MRIKSQNEHGLGARRPGRVQSIVLMSSRLEAGGPDWQSEKSGTFWGEPHAV